jgi:hypothetical protein
MARASEEWKGANDFQLSSINFQPNAPQHPRKHCKMPFAALWATVRGVKTKSPGKTASHTLKPPAHEPGCSRVPSLRILPAHTPEQNPDSSNTAPLRHQPRPVFRPAKAADRPIERRETFFRIPGARETFPLPEHPHPTSGTSAHPTRTSTTGIAAVPSLSGQTRRARETTSNIFRMGPLKQK